MRAPGCRTGLRVLVLVAMLAGATGCSHKVKVAVVPIPPPQQVPVDTTAKVEPPAPMVQNVPLQPTPLPAVKVPTKKKKKRKPRRVAATVASAAAPVPATSAPVQAASSGSAEANPIGALTPGGSEGPQLRKQATELIAALEKKLAGLPADIKESKKDQILRVMNFQHQAQTALAGGDSEGAVTLATKAKLLLDELMK